MPKRVLKHHLAQAAKIRRKSMLIDDPSQLAELRNEGDEEKNTEEEEPKEKAKKHMQYLKLNRNNEVERLLLHNAKSLLYHVDHCDFPAFNVGLWPQESNEALTNYPSCAFSMPRPIYVSNRQSEKIDICYKRPMTMEYHKTRMKHTRATYMTALKRK